MIPRTTAQGVAGDDAVVAGGVVGSPLRSSHWNRYGSRTVRLINAVSLRESGTTGASSISAPAGRGMVVATPRPLPGMSTTASAGRAGSVSRLRRMDAGRGPLVEIVVDNVVLVEDSLDWIISHFAPTEGLTRATTLTEGDRP